ncbi:MAG: GNAT family N-acetyltransferase [Roseiflexaceae bacterium]
MSQHITTRQLTADDSTHFAQLVALFHVVFENEHATIAPNTHLQQLLASRTFAVFVVFADDQLVGGCTTYMLPSYTSPYAELLIYDLAIHPDFQRRGLGTRLIHTVRHYCAQHQIPLFFVLAHADDEPAVEFYRASGAHLEAVVNALYPLS